ncbi:aminotransferase class V-fold PLP-dependent enzyme [Candidatus Saccharibacteria bacterium]|nr:aminotransferase class V-fold PLP-dependent enzyme [Candidatus Saccharibacteria bacterium]
MRKDFEYLDEKDVYLDGSCQSLRPAPVINAMREYYEQYNSCSERVKYKWGQTVDAKVEETRRRVLKWLGLSGRKYFTSFTLNTTYGINLVLSQIKPGVFSKIITSDIEHNSVFLPSIAFAKKHGIKRVLLSRNDDGSLPLDVDFAEALVVVNTVSNIDGRELKNLRELVKKVRGSGGRIILDAAQTMAHHSEILKGVEADAICFSAHKMYAASLGVVVCRQDFLQTLEVGFVGGGMVDDAREDDYDLSCYSSDHWHTIFEPGVQAYAEILALGEATRWLAGQDKKALERRTQKLYQFLADHPKVRLINQEPNAVMSFYVEGVDSHLLAASLSRAGVMARSGYFCCHYYLKNFKNYPPLLRFSLGHHNTDADIDRVIQALSGL